MQDRSTATSSIKPKPGAALLAAILAFALAFMAVDAGSLRSAFANEGEAASADATHEDDSTSQAAEPVDDGEDLTDEAVTDEAPESEEVTGDGDSLEEIAPEPPVSDEGVESTRAGPDAATEPEAQASASETDALASEPAPEDDPQPKERKAFSSATVTFYSNAYTDNPSILARKLVSAETGKTAVVTVSDVVASAPTSAQAFDGWLYNGRVYTDSIEIDPQDGNVSLYPAFSSGHWLRFTEGEAQSGASSVPSQFVSASQQAPSSLPITTRPGYAFEGWFMGTMDAGSISYGDQIASSDGTVADPQALKELLSRGDVQLYAKWIGIQSSYRVIIWHENPDDDGYSYHSAETIGADDGKPAISGEMTDVAQLPAFDGFELASADQQLIAGDGSTVVHARYDRIEYSVYFHNGRSTSSPLFTELTFSAKYGANVRDEWPETDSGGRYTSSWYTQPGTDDTFVNGINTMPLGGAHFYLKNDRGHNLNTVFLVQNVDGSNNFTTYLEQRFSSSFFPGTTPDDYMPLKGFRVNAASEADAAEIRNIPSGDDLATYDADFRTSTPVGTRYNHLPVITQKGDVARYTSHFYYLRCQYDLVFEENGGPEVADAKSIYYEASLTGLAPSDYVAGETKYAKPNGQTYVFAGWFSNDKLAGDAFDFEASTMPPNNLVLYAKWEPAEYLVQVDPAGGEFASETQSTYFWVDHGDTIGYIDAERDYVADDEGTHVYVYETHESDADGSFGRAQYVEAAAGDDSQRYRFAEDAYKLYGWYRIDGPARAQVPFDFNQKITEDTQIVARWQAAGVFDIAYDPTVEVSGVTVSGDIDTMLDAGYADLSPTVIMNTPTNIEASNGHAYTFMGWRVVESFEEGADTLIDQLFSQGDGFIVNSEVARNNTIHLQAVYDRAPDTPVDPEAPSDPDAEADPQDPSGSGGAEDAPEQDPQDSQTTLDTESTGQDSSTQEGSATTSEDTITQQVTTTTIDLLPKTGDDAQALAIGIAGIALAALGVALIARTIRRKSGDKEIGG